LFKDAVNC